MPSPKTDYVASFENFTGGINLKELEYRIGNKESPEIKNLWWRDGVLHCRDAQVRLGSSQFGTFHAVYKTLWHGYAFAHLGTNVYGIDMSTGSSVFTSSSVGSVPGTFFAYNDKLYYKTEGYYIAITYNSGSSFSGSSVASNAYTPVTYINCDPKAGAGSVYQPENRINSNATLWYNAARTVSCEGYTTSARTTVTYNPTQEEIDEGDEGFTVVLNQTDSASTKPIVEETSFVSAVGNTPGRYYFLYTDGVWKLITISSFTSSGISGVNIDAAKFADSVIKGIEDLGLNPAPSPWTSYSFTYSGMGMAEWDFSSGTGYNEMWSGNTIPEVNSFLAADGIFLPSSYSSGARFSFNLSYTNIEHLSDYGITFTGDLGESATCTVDFSFQREYYFPIEVDSVVSATVDDVSASYTLIRKSGSSGPIIGIRFNTAPVMRNPPINNTVKITYNKANTTAYNNIMDCTMAETYGGTGALAIVMAGSKTQPNAYFWNGQTSISVDPSYFPMTQYQLAGDTNEPITGFGKQQGYLIIFKKNSVGRTSMDTQTVEGRVTIDLAYVGINAKIGCDLPKTIQLVENNLTWCNTQMGVHFLANTSAAYENNIVCLSEKVNDSHQTWTDGLLKEVREHPETVTAHDDERHYWLVVNGHVWLWDYYISNYKDPSWYYFDNIVGRGFIQQDDTIWEFGSTGKIYKFTRDVYSDTDSGSIDKVIRLAAQYFGSYEYKKNVTSVNLTMGSATDLDAELTYYTDLETRKDLTNLVYDTSAVDPHKVHNDFGVVFKRKPMCRRVQFFTLKLEDDSNGDMVLVSAHVYYNYQGKIR